MNKNQESFVWICSTASVTSFPPIRASHRGVVDPQTWCQIPRERRPYGAVSLWTQVTDRSKPYPQVSPEVMPVHRLYCSPGRSGRHAGSPSGDVEDDGGMVPRGGSRRNWYHTQIKGLRPPPLHFDDDNDDRRRRHGNVGLRRQCCRRTK